MASLFLASFVLVLPLTTSFVPAPPLSRPPVKLRASPPSPNVKLNEFFKGPVPQPIKNYVSIKKEPSSPKQTYDIVELATAPPGRPGVPRPLWLVILASLPTGLLWYGYYKFCVEEELLDIELSAGKTPRGFGGYGTLGPFTYGILLGPIAAILHLPGGINWTTFAIIFIYYTQFLLYDRVNELYEEEGLEKPLNVWWCLPIFFPFNLIVGLRQVHFLSQYCYKKRGVDPPPSDPVADFFPFIKVPTLTWQEFLTTPRLWCSLLSAQNDIDRTTLPMPIRDLLAIGEDEKKR